MPRPLSRPLVRPLVRPPHRGGHHLPPDLAPTVPFTQPVDLTALPQQTFVDDFQATTASLAALAASGYATGDDPNGGYRVRNVASIAPGFVLTPEPDTEGHVSVPVYLAPPRDAVWLEVIARYSYPPEGGSGSISIEVADSAWASALSFNWFLSGDTHHMRVLGDLYGGTGAIDGIDAEFPEPFVNDVPQRLLVGVERDGVTGDAVAVFYAGAAGSEVYLGRSRATAMPGALGFFWFWVGRGDTAGVLSGCAGASYRLKSATLAAGAAYFGVTLPA